MTENNEFDDLIRSKMEENQFPFEEADWFEAEQLIDKHRNKEKRRRFFIIWFFGLFSGVILTVCFLWTYNSLSESGNNNNIVSNPSNIKEERSANLKENKSEYSKTNDKTIGTKGPINTLSIKTTSTEIYNEQPLVNKSNFISNVSKSNIQTPKKTNIIGSSSTPLSHEPKSNVVNDTQIAKNTTDSLVKQIIYPENKDSSVTKKAETNVVPTDTITNAALTDQTTDTTTNKTTADSLLVKENKEQRSPVNDDSKRNSKFNLFLSAGPTYQAGWQYNGNNDGKGLGFVSGLGLEYLLSKKVAVSSGMFVYNGGKLNNYYDSVNFGRPDFGKRDSILKCNYKRIYFAEIPFAVNYYLNNRNRFTAGINTSIASVTSCNLQTIMVTDPGLAIINEEKKYNYFRGVRKINIGAQFGYSYSLSKKWFIQLIFHYGFTDSMDDKVFRNESVVERNTNVRLNVNYKILSK